MRVPKSQTPARQADPTARLPDSATVSRRATSNAPTKMTNLNWPSNPPCLCSLFLSLALFVAFNETCAGHTLAQAALFNEVLF